MMARAGSGQAVVTRTAKGKGGALARLAGRMCMQAKFQEFVVLRAGPPASGVSGVQNAAEYVRHMCGITSRAALDHDACAALAFHELVRKPYLRSTGADA